MSFFKYCPNCKSDQIQFLNGNKFLCPDCNFEYYHNIAGAVAVIIQKGEEILLTIRNNNPQKGFLDLAGGFIDPSETSEETCARELKEELNIEINPEKLVYINSNPNIYLYKGVKYNTIDLFYLYKDDNLEINSFDNKELSGFIWKKLTDLDLNEIAFESQKRTLTLLKETILS